MERRITSPGVEKHVFQSFNFLQSGPSSNFSLAVARCEGIRQVL